jgi:hypothetical protein
MKGIIQVTMLSQMYFLASLGYHTKTGKGYAMQRLSRGGAAVEDQALPWLYFTIAGDGPVHTLQEVLSIGLCPACHTR